MKMLAQCLCFHSHIRQPQKKRSNHFLLLLHLKMKYGMYITKLGGRDEVDCIYNSNFYFCLFFIASLSGKSSFNEDQ